MPFGLRLRLGASRAFCLDQLCRLIACGLFGAVALAIWKIDLLPAYWILPAEFNGPVFAAAVLLMGLVALRSGTLCWDWHRNRLSLKQAPSMPLWRYAVLLPPLSISALLVYFCSNNLDFKGSRQALAQAKSELQDGERVDFDALLNAAIDPERREFFEGRRIVLTGLGFRLVDKDHRISDDQFIVMHTDDCFRIVSLANPRIVRVLTPETPTILRTQRLAILEVHGQIQFRKAINGNAYFPVLVVDQLENIRVARTYGF